MPQQPLRWSLHAAYNVEWRNDTPDYLVLGAICNFGHRLPARLLTAGCAGFSGLWSLSPAILPSQPDNRVQGGCRAVAT